MPRGRPDFDFEDIDYSYVNVEDLLPALGVDIAYVSHNNAGFKCPFHNDHTPSARMSVESSVWICMGCGEKGRNAVSFLAKLRQINMSEAKRIIEERYGGSLSAPIDDLESEVQRNLAGRHVEPETRLRPAEHWVKDFLDAASCPEVWADGEPPGVAASRVYMEQRGFSTDVLERWQCGFDWISNRVAIPVRNHEKELVGFKGRAWRDNHSPKYLILGDGPNRPERYGFQTYRKSEYVFGLDRCEYAPKRMIICEGELNVIAMDQHGWDNVVAVAGAEFSIRQAQLIIERAGAEVVVFFDDNDAGKRGTAKVADVLQPYVPVRAVLGTPGDAAELDRETIEQLLQEARPAIELQVRGLLQSVEG